MKLVPSSDLMKLKINFPKGLFLVGFTDTLGNGFSAAFWFLIAGFLLPEEYGQISYVIGIASLISMATLFGTQNTLVVYNAKNIKLNSTFNTISMLGGLLALVVVGIFQNRLDVGFLILGYILSILGSGYILGKKNYKDYTKLVLSQKILTFVLGIGFYFAFGPESIIIALALTYVGYSYIVYRGFRDSTFNLSLLKEKLGFVINNYAISVSTALDGQIDKLIIAPILGFVLLGNYSLALQVVTILFVIPGIVFKYTLSHDATGNRNKKLKMYTILIGVVTCILTIILAPLVIPSLFPKYDDLVPAIQIMSIDVIPATIAIFYVSKLLGMEKSKYILIGKLSKISTFVIGFVILGLTYGIIGLAISFVLAQTVEVLIYLSLRKKIPD
jgi:O-antigen/teichoic acid export membrane protein|tara:strand:- start:21059 stop:22219 length:1161 start_codon:yes stop_codon:yes gene_type:complete